MPRKGDAAKPDDLIRLRHMLNAAEQATRFMEGRVRDDLDHDDMLRRAVKDCIQEIGEAASRVTDETRARVTGVPWPKIVGMRHILVHAYYDIDVQALWDVTVTDLPVLVIVVRCAIDQWSA